MFNAYIAPYIYLIVLNDFNSNGILAVALNVKLPDDFCHVFIVDFSHYKVQITVRRTN